MKSNFTYFTFGFKFKIILFLSLFFSVSSQAQTEIESAKKYLSDHTNQYKLLSSDVNEMVVSSAYLSPTTGWYHIYFNQTYQSIEVYNGMLNLILKDGQVQYVANKFIENVAEKVPVSLKQLSVSPTQALNKTLTKLGISAANLQEINPKNLLNGIATQTSFTDATIADNNIEVKLYWLPYDIQENKVTKSKLALAWNVKFLAKNQQNAWSFHIDANSGEIIRQQDNIIHCNFGTPEHLTTPHECAENSSPLATQNTAKLAVAANSYQVFDYPIESPIHGTRTAVTSPYTRFFPASSGPGATNGWHNDGTTNYTTTRGNNVWAQEDVNDDDIPGNSPTSATLDFNYAYTKGLATSTGNQNAAITNLFYWNNLIHDVLWRYGFDEPSGNFQNNNQGRGGLGNDYVFADAQDGGGTNNANFYPPADGTNGRMQMYLWSNVGSPSFQPDGDFDNGIIAHEYGHGWSIRLTGGPANSNCLDNVEQGGEGWSDYLTLMLTTNWASLTPTVTSANIPRGIGTYVLGQTTAGAGIRPYRYSYDMANINAPVTYAKVGDVSFSEPHGIGSIWATMLWDMTWAIILQDNQIVNNIYETPTVIADLRGNAAALKLVNEGLRLQPCSPSFVDARDAILQADQLLFNGRYRCAIGQAFARRGLGVNASTGASSNDRIVTEDYNPVGNAPLTSAKTFNICTNTAFDYVATSSTVGATFSWTRPVVAGISNLASSGNTPNISEILINTTNAPIIVKYNFVLAPNTCSPITQVVSVTVTPSIVPTVSDYAVCQNGVVLNGEGLVVPASTTNVVDGVLTVGATYRRGGGDNTTTYITESTITAVYYKTYTFVAPSNGAVNFEITQAVLGNAGSDDTYMTLYKTSFDPANPATNFLRGDDDSGVSLKSSFTHTLVQGTTYIVVVSTYDNLTTGSFRLQLSIPIFPIINSWYKDASGGTALATGEIFNPVGISGSGITNTATEGTTTFYVSNSLYPTCKTATTFTINPPSVGGNITGTTSVCAGTNTSTLTLSGQKGNVQKWQSSTVANFATATDIANTTTSLTTSNLSQTTYYRAILKSGACVAANSQVATITAVPMPTILSGSANNPTLCSLSNGSINFTSVNLPDGSYSVSYTGADSPQNVNVLNNSFSVSGLKSGIYSNFSVNRLGCVGTDISTKTLIDSLPSGTTNKTICYNSIASLSGTCLGNTMKWYDSTGTILKGTGTTFTTENLSNNTTYKTRCENLTCQSAFIDVLVTVNAISPIPNIQKDTLLLLGDTITLKATNCVGVGSALKWYQALNDVAVNMPLSPIASSQYYATCEKTQNTLACPSLKSNILNVALTSVIKSVSSGDWEIESTWDISRIPKVGISVIIQPNHTVIVNGIGTAKNVEYNGTGSLKFNNASSKLNIGL
ncbi:fungalysin/thermolysin propeptide [Arcicella aurantiaca]|uniref:Fungalysin/thermolysin propeptide n=1 Tax=Arcicella aurantiaca TaxID=591202 RepID=A0A316EHA9_9BACT|nr:M36 family metallopeptidase [Arcicella aurantiaca]PWK28865.1 fungalysin/thermolysin propeptide [Arcicella aurantiaca]